MGWTLSYLTPEEPKLLDEFFLAVGKVLYLACEFESKCADLLRFAEVVDSLTRTQDGSASATLAKAVKHRSLGQTIGGMKRPLPFVTEEDIAQLEQARRARNYIAHESTSIGWQWCATAEVIRERLSRLHTKLMALAAGDNLVSRWTYEIDEREPAPSEIQRLYPEWASEWVFGKRPAKVRVVPDRGPVATPTTHGQSERDWP